MPIYRSALLGADTALDRIYEDITKIRDQTEGELHALINSVRHGIGALPRYREAADRIEVLESALSLIAERRDGLEGIWRTAEQALEAK